MKKAIIILLREKIILNQKIKNYIRIYRYVGNMEIGYEYKKNN